MNGNLPNKQKVCLMLSADLVEIAKEHSESKELSLTELVERALIDYLPKANNNA
jgi:hypothetical protein